MKRAIAPCCILKTASFFPVVIAATALCLLFVSTTATKVTSAEDSPDRVQLRLQILLERSSKEATTTGGRRRIRNNSGTSWIQRRSFADDSTTRRQLQSQSSNWMQLLDEAKKAQRQCQAGDRPLCQFCNYKFQSALTVNDRLVTIQQQGRGGGGASKRVMSKHDRLKYIAQAALCRNQWLTSLTPKWQNLYGQASEAYKDCKNDDKSVHESRCEQCISEFQHAVRYNSIVIEANKDGSRTQQATMSPKQFEFATDTRVNVCRSNVSQKWRIVVNGAEDLYKVCQQMGQVDGYAYCRPCKEQYDEAFGINGLLARLLENDTLAPSLDVHRHFIMTQKEYDRYQTQSKFCKQFSW